MRWNQWTRWLRRRSDDDFSAEIASHLDMEVERLVASGVSGEEALFAARRAFETSPHDKSSSTKAALEAPSSRSARTFGTGQIDASNARLHGGCRRALS